jgi:CHASE3 domain sensor protein
MFKRLKHGTTALVQSMKKAAGPPYLDPEFETASANFKQLRDTLGLFHEDANALLVVLPKLTKSISEFAVSLQKCYETLPAESRDEGVPLAPFADKIPKVVQEEQAKVVDETVIKQLTDLLARMEELAVTQREQHDSFLILESNRAKLEGLQKDPQKNAAEIQRFTEKITARTDHVKQLEASFIGLVNATWEHRFDIITPPMRELLAFISWMGSMFMTESAPVRAQLGAELLATDFPLAEAPPPKK